MPPPIPLVCGLVLAFVALQMLLGRKTPWLPRALLVRSIGKPELNRAVERALPPLVWLERFSRPRLTMLGSPYAVPVLGLVILILALGLIVAAPFIGQIPLGLAVCLVGLGLVEDPRQLLAIESGDWAPVPRPRERRDDAQALFTFGCGCGCRAAFNTFSSARSSSSSCSSSLIRTRTGSQSSPHGVP